MYKEDELKDYLNTYYALASFMNDLALLKQVNNVTQKQMAEFIGTTQSSISRIETLKTNPSYKQLQKLAKSVNGSFYITPMGDMTITVPFGIQEKVKKITEVQNISVKEFLLNIIKESVKEYDFIQQSTTKFFTNTESEYKSPKITNDEDILKISNLQQSDLLLAS